MKLMVMPYKLGRDNYELWFSLVQQNDQPISSETEKKVKLDIRKHPSIEYFKSPFLHPQRGVYQIKVYDEGYSKGVIRILSRVNGVKIYPFVVMPVIGEIEHVKFFIEDPEGIDDSKILGNCKDALKQDKNIQIVDEHCQYLATSIDDMWNAHPNFFNTFIHMEKTDYDLMLKIMGSQEVSLMKELTENENFFNLVRKYGELFWKFIEIISGLITLKEIYELIQALRHLK